MPNVHASDKEMLGFYVPRTLSRRVRKAAKASKQSITSYIEIVLTSATSKIELTPQDYREIAEATERHANQQIQSGTRVKGATPRK
ncbi:hypothetical protein UFOVP813_12 [uncultured Caudovirales phage]|uniref:Uncharacterized protein n=1 Tax=uncultured Caudovirales phage TaxID=2100421 RepID=A0A6J5P6Z4_9CAUD|nr:hypothetical protein UFOVP813_12 [uncultured Caudovirales phage]